MPDVENYYVWEYRCVLAPNIKIVYVNFIKSTASFLLINDTSILSFTSFQFSFLILFNWRRSCCSASRFGRWGDITANSILLLVLLKEFFCCTRKYFLYIVTCLGTGLKNLMNCMLFSKLNCSFFLNFSLFVHFSLVTNKVNFYIFSCVLLNFF